VLEGCDRVGKTTQAKLLVENLVKSGKKAKYMNFPDRSTPIGSILDKYLRQTQEMDDHAVHLLFSANRWEAAKQMEEDINTGTTLIVDRYAYSGIAFSHAKGMPWDWCAGSDAGLMKADLVLYLTLQEKESQAREGFGGERYEKETFQAAVRRAFDKFRDQNWKIVGCDGLSIDALQQQLLSTVTEAVSKHGEGPLQRL